MTTERLNKLSSRERQVLAYKAAGHTCIEIARATGISEATVHGHLYRSYAKLGACNDVSACITALRRGEITDEMIDHPDRIQMHPATITVSPAA